MNQNPLQRYVKTLFFRQKQFPPKKLILCLSFLEVPVFIWFQHLHTRFSQIIWSFYNFKIIWDFLFLSPQEADSKTHIRKKIYSILYLSLR